MSLVISTVGLKVLVTVHVLLNDHVLVTEEQSKLLSMKYLRSSCASC